MSTSFPLRAGCALVLSLAGCDAPNPNWTVVGAYEVGSTLLSDTPQVPKEGWNGAGFVWKPPEGMVRSCGPAKSPLGLGLPEMVGMANGLTPTLAIVLESSERGHGVRPLTDDDVRVSLGRGAEPELRLQPAVEPRFLAVEITGAGQDPFKQLLRTQVQMEACLEHKVARSWVSAEETQDPDSKATLNNRQAFLLDAPKDHEGRLQGPDRTYFLGQREPVPPYLGPPDACLKDQAQPTEGAKGEGSLSVVPSDIWGSALRVCGPDEVAGGEVAGEDRRVPLQVSGLGDIPLTRERPRWTGLVVDVGPGEQDSATLGIRISAWDQGTRQLTERSLYLPTGDPGKLFWSVGSENGLVDVLARVPQTYPLLRAPPANATPDEPGPVFTVLLVPNWQLVEGLRRLDARDPSKPLAMVGADPWNGVAWVLDHPEQLFVQVRPEQSRVGAQWPNLASVMRGSPLGLRRWGYATGLRSGRRPIVLPGKAIPTWVQARTAQRAVPHAAFLASSGILLVLLGAGLARVRELWARVPEERADYWPGKPTQKAEPTPEAPQTTITG